MTGKHFELETRVTGTINGVDFVAEGTGESVEGSGRSNATLKFSNLTPNFTPMLCKSWACKHHESLARIADGTKNIFAKILDQGGTIYATTLIQYPFDQDMIIATSMCTRPAPGKQVVRQTRLGTYSGPIDIIQQLPFVSHFYPAGPGKAKAESMRQVVRRNGEKISIRYSEEYMFPEEFQLSGEIIVTYSGSAIWTPDTLTFKLETEVATQVSVIVR
jgi:hypothetical protein